MHLNGCENMTVNHTPIYQQVADWLENEILTGHYQAHARVPSQYQLAELFTINPATAGKGLTLLLEQNILYKKRGLGMFVVEDAQQRLQYKRQHVTLTELAQALITEARRVELTDEALIQLIKTLQEEGARD